MDAEEAILAIARDVLEDDTLLLTASRDEVPTWDSLQHAELLITVEEELEVTLSSQDLASIGSLLDIVEAVIRAGSDE